VIICSDCNTCVIPRRASQEQHLRVKPHKLRGDALKATLQWFSSYSLRTVEELRANKPKADDRVARIKHLAAYKGFRCLQQPDCAFSTRNLVQMKAHIAAHKKKGEDQLALAGPSDGALWVECTLQTYFIRKGRIDYFVVVVAAAKEEDNSSSGSDGQGLMPLTEPQKAYFAEIKKDFDGVKDDIAA